MTINAGYEYFEAEKKYYAAKTIEDKITALEEMIRTAPKHKSSEKFVAELKNRLRNMVEKKEKLKSSGKSTRKVIRKEGFQCALVGLPNSGKSFLLTKLTNAKSRVDSYAFTTKQAEIGTMDYHGVKSQIVDMPSIGSDAFDIGTVNTADCIILVITSLDEIEKIKPHLNKTVGKVIVAINKIDLLDNNQLRKLEETIRSRKIPGILVSAETEEGIEELKEKIFLNMNSIRIYTKEPGKSPSPVPVVLKQGSTVKDVAESILKGFSKKVKESRVSGPSSKFANQIVGLDHVLKDKDIVEFKTF